MSWFVHHVVYRDLKINLRFKALSPLRIGAGKAKKPTSPIDLQVLTIKINEAEVPFIPGSSLKGVFRSSSEFIARSSGIKGICMAGEGCREKNDNNNKLQMLMRSNELDELVEHLKKYCLICKMYGSSSYASHIFFGDAYPPWETLPERGVKTGIAINRRSGTVRRGALYTVEFVTPGSVFNGFVEFRNIPNYGMGLFSVILDQINSGFLKIGGFKSRGFGRVKVDAASLSGYVFTDGDRKDLRELSSLPGLDEDDEEIKVNAKDPSAFLNECKRAWWDYVKRVKSRG